MTQPLKIAGSRDRFAIAELLVNRVLIVYIHALPANGRPIYMYVTPQCLTLNTTDVTHIKHFFTNCMLTYTCNLIFVVYVGYPTGCLLQTKN